MPYDMWFSGSRNKLDWCSELTWRPRIREPRFRLTEEVSKVTIPRLLWLLHQPLTRFDRISMCRFNVLPVLELMIIRNTSRLKMRCCQCRGVPHLRFAVTPLPNIVAIFAAENAPCSCSCSSCLLVYGSRKSFACLFP